MAELALSQATLAEKSLQVESLRSQLAEVTATANSQAAELRVLRRQRQLDAEHLKACETAHRSLHERQQAQALQLAEAQRLRIAAEADARTVHTGRKSNEHRQSKQSRADKAILVRALEALADELAQARAEARQHCAAAERARNAAQRLGQLGQLGLELLEAADDGGGTVPQAGEANTPRTVQHPAALLGARAVVGGGLASEGQQ
mmetsp:Transcript_59179/g.141907  ORF Transcript_59179/g.141907 Transcript_59179/m.141907 type:complete len:205 (+) Transcript_59179:73-687(+)